MQNRLLLPSGKPSTQWEVMVSSFIADLYEIPILAPERYKAERADNQIVQITIRPPNVPAKLAELTRYDSDLRTVSPDELQDLRKSIEPIAGRYFKPYLLDFAVTELVMRNPQPNYRYDPALHQERQRAAFAAEPPVTETFEANQVIRPAGTELKDEDLRVLQAEREEFEKTLRGTGLPILSALGHVGAIGLIGLMLWAYILAYNPRVAQNPVRGLAVTALLLLAQIMALALTASISKALYLGATLPTLLTATVLAITYDRRFALTVGAVHALLIVLMLNLPIEFGLVLLTGMATMVGQLNEVRTRTKLVLTGAVAGVAMSLATLVIALAMRPGFFLLHAQTVRTDVLLSLLSGVLAGVSIYAILPWIEGLFKVTTALSLKELNDASHPLLRHLAQESPGTYQHSLRIADLAEAAADAIGADSLLCKVGAMYHDIGKINKPLYFVENQGGGPNRHNKLSPAMSLLIIVGHVKDGMELAREYGLPPSVRQFIETHHGTTLVEYFFHAARQQRDAQDGPEPSEFEYRYPGPKPQTREAAILMLCDAVEGAARTLPEPNPARLEQLVHAMAQKRLADGQFDECSLTLQELHKIEQSLIKTLCAVYHGRIAYPKSPLGDAEPGRTSAQAS